MRRDNLRKILFILSLALCCGCAVSTEYMNREVLFNAASLSNFPQAVAGHALVQADLKSYALTFHYLREDPPSELWICLLYTSPSPRD